MTPQKKFRFSIADMLLTAGTIIMFMREDAIEFAQRGVSAADIDAFEAEIEAQKLMMSDTQYKYDVVIVTEQKSELLSTLKMKMRAVAGMFKLVYGQGNINYETLEIKKLPQMTEADIYLLARRMAILCEEDFGQLSAVGLTVADIEELRTMADELLNLKHIIAQKKMERELATIERIERANEAFTKLQYFCHVGRLIFDNTNPAKARSYMLYRNMGKKKRKKEEKKDEMGEIADGVV